MTKTMTSLVLLIFLILSMTAVYIVGQNTKINTLIHSQQQLEKKNQALAKAYSSVDKQLTQMNLINKPESASVNNSESELNSGQLIIKTLSSIQNNFINLHKKIEKLEANLNLIASQQNTKDQGIDEINNAITQPTVQPSIEQRMARAGSKQKALKQYFQSIDQTILQTIDTAYTQTVQYSYEDVINSREDWANDTSVKSSECGTGFCKVVLNYKDSMDPVSQFEFDAMAYSQVPELPHSRSLYKKNTDGTTDLVIYATRSGSEFPSFQ